VKKSTANERKEHNVEKYIQWVTTLSLTIRVDLFGLAVVASQICEILRNSLKAQGHPRSSILVSIKSAYATSY